MATGVERGQGVSFVIRRAPNIAAIEQNQGTGAGDTLINSNAQKTTLDRDIADEGVGGAQIQGTGAFLVGEDGSVNTFRAKRADRVRQAEVKVGRLAGMNNKNKT